MELKRPTPGSRSEALYYLLMGMLFAAPLFYAWNFMAGIFEQMRLGQ